MKTYFSFAAITGLFLLLMPLLSEAESESERSDTKIASVHLLVSPALAVVRTA
jgi:hypothetical protein